jgi:hypothetical protein
VAVVFSALALARLYVIVIVILLLYIVYLIPMSLARLQVSAPLFTHLLKHFRVAPERVGSADEVDFGSHRNSIAPFFKTLNRIDMFVVNEGGSLFVKQLVDGVERNSVVVIHV